MLSGWLMITGALVADFTVLMLVEEEMEEAAGLGTFTTSWWCCFGVSTTAPPTGAVGAGPVTAAAAAAAVVATVRWGIASTFFDSIWGVTTAVGPPLMLLFAPLAYVDWPLLATPDERWP